VLAARRRPYHNIEDFTRLGLDPKSARLLVVKSGYLSPELAPIANPNLMALTDGVVNQDIEGLASKRRLRPAFPFDRELRLSIRSAPFSALERLTLSCLWQGFGLWPNLLERYRPHHRATATSALTYRSMTALIPDVFRNPTIRVSMLAIFAYGFAGAATSPYQSVIGIRELGLSNGIYSALIFAAAAVNVIVSILRRQSGRPARRIPLDDVVRRRLRGPRLRCRLSLPARR
jgi:hypothetical protein